MMEKTMTTTNDATKKFFEEAIQNEFPKLIEMFEKHLDFKRWGFKLTHSGVFPQCLPFIFYQSNQCKIRFSMAYEEHNYPPAIFISYGRLHAPVDQSEILWNGKECSCWHDLNHVLLFLDGLSPSDAAVSKVPRKFYEFSEANPKPPYGGPWQEHRVKREAYIWDSYGQRLFDLFDLRRPDLWEEYRSFLKQYYQHIDKLRGKTRSTDHRQPYDVS
jgi:hypothetical protein